MTYHPPRKLPERILREAREKERLAQQASQAAAKAASEKAEVDAKYAELRRLCEIEAELTKPLSFWEKWATFPYPYCPERSTKFQKRLKAIRRQIASLRKELHES